MRKIEAAIKPMNEQELQFNTTGFGEYVPLAGDPNFMNNMGYAVASGKFQTEFKTGPQRTKKTGISLATNQGATTAIAGGPG